MNLADYLLDQRVREGQGNSVALVTDERSYTYAEVQALANQAAHVLSAAGLEPEQRVMLALPDSVEYVAALFGTLKLGAVVVMANPDLKREQLADLLDYTRATVALVADPFDGPKACLTQDELRRRMETALAEHPTYPSHRDDVAIWLFSGGTTGRPKAVLQSHRSYVNTTELYAKQFLGYRASDRTIAVPKLFFGYAMGSNLFFPFSVGASAVLFPEKPTPEVLFDKIARHQPTILINVPTMVNQMVQHGPRDLSSLRWATSAGEALPETLYWKWRESFGCELLDGLGTAEMWHIFLSNRPGEVRPGSLGRVVPGFEVSVRDEDGQELPPGQVGRLWVSGDSRALCYWQDADKSQDAFRGRFYVSSDLVSQDPDGYFHYSGRGDELLKVAGRWVAPQEVESCLLLHPAVRECAVVGVVGDDGLTRPHAFVVAHTPDAGLEEILKAHVLSQLEPYKHPRRVVLVETLPRTHLGKVDRGALARC